jgi:hypothetical protein
MDMRHTIAEHARAGDDACSGQVIPGGVGVMTAVDSSVYGIVSADSRRVPGVDTMAPASALEQAVPARFVLSAATLPQTVARRFDPGGRFAIGADRENAIEPPKIAAIGTLGSGPEESGLAGEPALITF